MPEFEQRFKQACASTSPDIVAEISMTTFVGGIFICP